MNPRAVVLSVNGFGAESEWRDKRAYAPIVHAITGLLRDRGASGSVPTQPRIAYSDVLTALHGAVALLAGLRMAEATGQGQHIEVPMFDATLASHSEAGNVLIDPAGRPGDEPDLRRGPHGWIAVGGAAQHVWMSLAAAFPDELRDPSPKGAELEAKARARHDAVAAFLAAQPSLDAALERLARAKLAAAPVVTPKEALLGPLARERALLTPVDDGRGGTRPVVRSPARFSAAKNEVRGRAPGHGEHGAELLRELLGWDPERIRALTESGALLVSGRRSAERVISCAAPGRPAGRGLHAQAARASVRLRSLDPRRGLQSAGGGKPPEPKLDTDDSKAIYALGPA